MADPQIPTPTTSSTNTDPDTTRNSGPEMLARARAGLSVEQHQAKNLTEAALAEAVRQLAARDERVRELEAVASKAAITDQAQQHEIAVIDRKADLEMGQTLHQWKLDTARRDHERQLVEVDQARSAVAEAKRVAEIRKQCESVAADVAATHAACAVEKQRITKNSILMGAGAGFALGGVYGSMQQTNSSNPVLVGLGGTAAATLPIVAQHLLGSKAPLPPPTTPSGWDAHLLRLSAELTQAQANLASLRATIWSPGAMAAGMAGGAAVGYVVGAHGNGSKQNSPTRRSRPRRDRTARQLARH